MESWIQNALLEVLIGATGFVGIVFMSWAGFIRGSEGFEDGRGSRLNVWQYHVLPSGWFEEFECRHLEGHQKNTHQ